MDQFRKFKKISTLSSRFMIEGMDSDDIRKFIEQTNKNLPADAKIGINDEMFDDFPCRFVEKLTGITFCSILEDLCLREKCEPWMLCSYACGEIFPGAADTYCTKYDKDCERTNCKDISDNRFL